MKEQLAALYALQQQDNALNELKRQFALLDSGQTEKAEFDFVDAANKGALDALHTVSGELKDAELEQQQIDAKRKEYETKLYGGTIHNPKELQAMQDEVDMLARQRTKLDDKILILMDSLEVRKTEQAATKERSRHARAALKARIANYNASAEAIREQAKALVAARNAFVAPISAPLLKRYEALRGVKAGVAIVEIQDGNACGGCKMALPSSLVTRVHAGSGIEICQNCGRILCDPGAKSAMAAGRPTA